MTIDEIEETLLLISERSNDEGAALAAFKNLYKNYSKFLFKKNKSSVKNDTFFYFELKFISNYIHSIFSEKI